MIQLRLFRPGCASRWRALVFAHLVLAPCATASAVAGLIALSCQASAQNVQAPPTVIVPALADEMPGIRIGWRMNDFNASFEDAKRDGKPVVALFVGDVARTNDLPYIQAFFAHVLRCPTFNTLAGSAHFVIVDPASRPDYALLAAAYKVDVYRSMIYVTVEGDSASAKVSSYGPFNEKGVLQDAQAAGLEPRKPGWLADSARLGSPKPEACITASGDAAIVQAISPDKLSRVKVVFQGG